MALAERWSPYVDDATVLDYVMGLELGGSDALDVWDASCQIWAFHFDESAGAEAAQQLNSIFGMFYRLELDGVEAFCSFGLDHLIWEACYEGSEAGVFRGSVVADRAVRNLDLPGTAGTVFGTMVESAMCDQGSKASTVRDLAGDYALEEIAVGAIVAVCTSMRAFRSSMTVAGRSESASDYAAQAITYFTRQWAAGTTTPPVTSFAMGPGD